MIPLSSPHITKREIEYVNNVLNSRHLALGPYLKKFEDSFKKLINAKYSIAVNSGTSALHLLLRAIDFKREDEIITSSFTFISSSNSDLPGVCSCTHECYKKWFRQPQERVIRAQPK